jgi:hypothetical protein
MLKIPYICADFDDDVIDLNKLLNEVNITPGKKVKEVLLSDFILTEPKSYELNHGVYIFKEDEQIKYIGKASSRPFIERVPAHLDVRVNGWMNTLLKYLCTQKNPTDYYKEAKEVLENHQLILIVFRKDYSGLKEKISTVERFLIDNTNCLNKKKRLR